MILPRPITINLLVELGKKASETFGGKKTEKEQNNSKKGKKS